MGLVGQEYLGGHCLTPSLVVAVSSGKSQLYIKSPWDYAFNVRTGLLPLSPLLLGVQVGISWLSFPHFLQF